MFDELHDPNPPTAGMREFAAVAERAQGIRRRRATWAVRVASIALVFVAGFAWYQLSNRTDDAPAAPEVTEHPAPSTTDVAPAARPPLSLRTALETSTLPAITLGPGALTVNPDPVVELFETADGDLCARIDGTVDQDSCRSGSSGLYATEWAADAVIAADPGVEIDLPSGVSCAHEFPNFAAVQLWICSDFDIDTAVVTDLGDKHLVIDTVD